MFLKRLYKCQRLPGCGKLCYHGHSLILDTYECKFTLYEYNEIPEHLQGNPHVTGGYRAFMPLRLAVCCKSLFVWSNESVNIWSHIFGFGFFFILMLYDNFTLIPNTDGSLMDHFIISVGLLCFQFCMVCSVGYHLLNCHSEQTSQIWLGLDLTGILIGLLGCYLPGVHYAFYCLSIWRDIYLVIIATLFAAVFICTLSRRYATESWRHRRTLLYISICLYGILPTLHWIYLNGGFSSTIVQMFLYRIVVVYLFGILAFFFYITKFPECCFPGWFDYIGSSHQWWHVIVVVTFWWWHQSGQAILKYRLEHHCITN